MNEMDEQRSAALVMETNNLRAGDADHTERTLLRLLEHLQGQTHPLASLRELVITHDGLSPAAQARIEAAAGMPVRFVRIGIGDGYYRAKVLGFEATTADVVVFGDADCWPEAHWLERILAPFAAGARVVAGRTRYRDDWLGQSATALDFLYFESDHGPGHRRNFYANNVAFRRDVFVAHPYRSASRIYRGHCQRLGLELAEAGVPIVFAEDAVTVHRFPDSAGELLRLRLLRGADSVEMTAPIVESVLPPRLHWLASLGPLSPMLLLSARLACSVAVAGKQGEEPAALPMRLACAAGAAAISFVDGWGALLRSTLGVRLGVVDGSLASGALSYHGDGDRLASAPAQS
jgi:hypothetical protein